MIASTVKNAFKKVFEQIKDSEHQQQNKLTEIESQLKTHLTAQ